MKNNPISLPKTDSLEQLAHPQYGAVKYIAMASCLALIMLWSTIAAFAHNDHTSLTDIVWNDRDGSIEVIVQMHSHALEEKLSSLENQRLIFLREEDYSKINQAAGFYLQDVLSLKLNGETVHLQYLGSESDGQNVTLYLEASWPVRPEKMEFMNSMFLGELPGQTNTVIANVQNKKQGGEITTNSGPLIFTF